MGFARTKRWQVRIAFMALVLLGSGMLWANRTLAANHAASTTSPIVSTTSRYDAQTLALHLLGTVNAAQIPTMTAAPLAKPQTIPDPTFWDKQTYAQRKAAALHGAAPQGPANPAPVAGSSRAPVPDTPAPTTVFHAITQSNYVPSDMGLAAGNGYIVQIVNEELAVFSTTGQLQPGWPKTMQSFFHVPASNLQFNPRAVYDGAHGRFFVLADDVEGLSSGTRSSTYYLGVSATANPNGAWHLYSLAVGENLSSSTAAWSDFPGLGLDSEALYFTGNRFHYSDASFANSFVAFASLTGLESGANQVTTRAFDNLTAANGPAFAVAPAIEYGTPRAEMLIDTDLNCHTLLCYTYDVWAISNPLGSSPRLSYARIIGPSWSLAPAANQPNAPDGTPGAQSIGATDPRVSGTPVWRGDSLYFAFTTGYNNLSGTNVAAVLWLQLNLGLDTGSTFCGALPNRCAGLASALVREDFLLGYGGTSDAYVPALAVDTDGDFLMTFTYSSASTPPTVALYGHRATTPPNTWGTTAQTLSQGTSAAYWSYFRWGSYSAVTLDPAACNVAGCFTFWSSGMYVTSDGRWATTISAATYTVLQP